MRRIAAVLSLVLAPLAFAMTADIVDSRPFVARVFYDDPSEIQELMDYDLWEFNDRVLRYVLVAVDADELATLAARGFRVEIDAERTAALHAPRPIEAAAAIPGFPCYRTVEETYAAAQALVTSHPGLASWSDVGDSWDKGAGFGGYDLHVLRLTNAAVSGIKPRMMASCSIHAREYAPAELCTRFAEYLVAGYGTDPDATWLLDFHEIHLMLNANPDGRKKAETGQFWRKNTNRNYCSPTSNQRGADLNRNFAFGWGCCGGSSGSPCNETYRGPSAMSEPEVQAIQSYLQSHFPDQRGEALSDPAPPSATGVYVDVHSFSELVLWPWGFEGPAPNATALRTLGRKLAWFNDYTPQQSVDLYVTDGTTIDFGYGSLGVASFVFEIGTDFFQSCTSFENTVYPDNLQALIYLARNAGRPYLTPAGPDSLAVEVFPGFVAAGTTIDLAATLDDTRTNDSNGAEPKQPVVAAEAYVDVPPWRNIGGLVTPWPLTADDGSFNETVETASASIATSGLAGGRHTLFVRARDAAGNWGPVGAALFWIAGGDEGTVSGAVIRSGNGLPLAATVEVESLGVSAEASGGDGSYALPLPPGDWTVRASAPYHFDQTVELSVSPESVTLQDFVLVLDDDDGDDVADALDCAPSDAALWAAPSSAQDLRWGVAENAWEWDAPAEPGATAVLYDVLRSADPTDFTAATCIASGQTAQTVGDSSSPLPDVLQAYLVRARNACGGTLGADSAGTPRSGAACP